MKRFAIWTAVYLALLWASYAGSRQAQELALEFPPRWKTLAFALSMTTIVLGTVFAAAVMSRVYRIRRDNLARTLPIHLLAAILLNGVVLLQEAVLRWLDIRWPFPSTPEHSVNDLFPYFIFVALIHAFRMARESHHNDRRALELGVELSEAARLRTEAELRALKSELNPRFVADAVETIAGLVRTAPQRAEEAIVQLGGIVNTGIQRGSIQRVSLEEELQTLQPYIELERARLGGRLDVDVQAEPALDALVPDMVLHPLVAAALEGQPAPGSTPRLTITASRAGDTALAIRVVGTGLAAPSGGRAEPERPWENAMRWRLSQMFGDAARLDVSRSPSQAVSVLTIPDQDMERRATASRPAGAPARDSVLKRELKRVPLTVLGLVAWYRYDVWSDAKAAMERRVYGPELPSFYFEMRSGLTALVLTIIVLAAVEMNRRFPWTDATISVRRRLSYHAAAVLGVGILLVGKNASTYLVYGLVLDTSAANVAVLLVRSLVGAAMIYAMAATINFTLVTLWSRLRGYRHELRLKREVSESQRLRAEAELRALEAELNPHFLGNALHTAAALIRTSPEQASHLLTQLRLLVSAPASHAGAHEVSVAEELAMLHPYLEIERARIRRPLTVRWNVEPEALGARVPRMMLQPLVENAIRHGLATQSLSGSGGIELCVRRNGMRLEIAVSDDGGGEAGAARPAGPRRSSRVGVANTRARLRELYGEGATFDLDARAEGGMVARLSIPWREARDPVPPPPQSPMSELVPA